LGASGTHGRVVRVGVRVGHAKTFRSVHDWENWEFLRKAKEEKGRDFRVSFPKKKKKCAFGSGYVLKGKMLFFFLFFFLFF
jgi:hypothetical protein